MHYETSIEDFEFSSDIKSTRSQDLVEVEKCWPALVVFLCTVLMLLLFNGFEMECTLDGNMTRPEVSPGS